jgi:hypothetical protein
MYIERGGTSKKQFSEAAFLVQYSIRMLFDSFVDRLLNSVLFFALNISFCIALNMCYTVKRR